MMTVQCSKSKSEIANISSSLIASKTEDRKKLSEGTKWIFIVHKINVATLVRRPIKGSLIPIDINKSSGSTVIRRIPKCKFREYPLSGSGVVACTKRRIRRFLRTQMSLK
jgi:hypothetical protein